jgi:capsular exopolysaccharide synthesis family protein
VSVNTAKTLASLNNNKVLLVGLDLRNPQLHTALNISRNSSLGLSNFLMDNTIKIDSITEKVGEIDVIQSGPIPPNPTELLLSSNLQEIIKIAESKYDYVILDTSPCILVSDTLNFSKLASQTIYVTRSNHTDNNLLNYVNKLYSDKVFNKLSIVINGISDANLNYGYSYGYDQTTK